MFDKGKFLRVAVPMITPFREDQSVDCESAAEAAQTLVERNSADSIIETCVNGKLSTLNERKQKHTFDAVLKEVRGKIPRIACIVGNCMAGTSIIAYKGVRTNQIGPGTILLTCETKAYAEPPFPPNVTVFVSRQGRKVGGASSDVETEFRAILKSAGLSERLSA